MNLESSTNWHFWLLVCYDRSSIGLHWHIDRRSCDTNTRSFPSRITMTRSHARRAWSVPTTTNLYFVHVLPTLTLCSELNTNAWGTKFKVQSCTCTYRKTKTQESTGNTLYMYCSNSANTIETAIICLYLKIRWGDKYRRMDLNSTNPQQEDKAFPSQKRFSAQLISVVHVLVQWLKV